MISRGDVLWAELAAPVGSEAGYRRPVVVVQRDSLNRSPFGTVSVVPLTSNMKWLSALGNVVLPASETGLPKDSVAAVALVAAIDRSLLRERVGRVERRSLDLLVAGINVAISG